MARLNYQKRFNNSSTVDVSAVYDPLLDSGTWKGYRPKRAKSGTLEACFNASHGLSALSAKRRNAKKPPSRSPFEQAMIERIGKAIEVLEFGLEELNLAPVSTKNDPAKVNRLQVIEAIEKLKYHCGIKN